MSLTLAVEASALTPYEQASRIIMTQRDVPVGYRAGYVGDPLINSMVSALCTATMPPARFRTAQQWKDATKNDGTAGLIYHEVTVYDTVTHAAAVLTKLRYDVAHCRTGVWFGAAPSTRRVDRISWASNSTLPVRDNAVVKLQITRKGRPAQSAMYFVQRQGATVSVVQTTSLSTTTVIHTTSIAAAMRVAILTGRRQLLP